MKTKIITDFASQFGIKLVFNDEMITQCEGRFFLLNNNIKPAVKDNFFYAGTFLGKVRTHKFFPSFTLLSMLAKQEANRVIIDKKAAWLFICGRDIFQKSILQTYGKIHKNDHILILNEFKECLGFGKVLTELKPQTDKNMPAIANVLDIGDFLRRERNK